MKTTGSYHPGSGGVVWWALVWNSVVVVLLLLQLVRITECHVSQESELPDQEGTKYQEHLYNGSQSVFLDADLITVSRFDDDDDDDGHRLADDDGMQGDEPGLPFTEHSYAHHHAYHRRQQQQHESHHKLSCEACQYRNVYAKASLKSIKAHFLMKLGFERTPNGTQYPVLPDPIIELYQDSLPNSAPVGHKESYDYQSDEPYGGGGGGGGGMQADEPDEQDDDYDYYQITNKIFILPNQA